MGWTPKDADGCVGQESKRLTSLLRKIAIHLEVQNAQARWVMGNAPILAEIYSELNRQEEKQA